MRSAGLAPSPEGAVLSPLPSTDAGTHTLRRQRSPHGTPGDPFRPSYLELQPASPLHAYVKNRHPRNTPTQLSSSALCIRTFMEASNESSQPWVHSNILGKLP